MFLRLEVLKIVFKIPLKTRRYLQLCNMMEEDLTRKERYMAAEKIASTIISGKAHTVAEEAAIAGFLDVRR